jgi:hypothetical protein
VLDDVDDVIDGDDPTRLFCWSTTGTARIVGGDELGDLLLIGVGGDPDDVGLHDVLEPVSGLFRRSCRRDSTQSFPRSSTT